MLPDANDPKTARELAEGKTPTVQQEKFYEDGRLVERPQGVYSNDLYTAKMLEYLEEGRRSGKPFFAYLAFTTAHFPIQAPSELIEKYYPLYLKKGYEEIKRSRFEALKRRGVIPKSAKLPDASSNPLVKQWSSLSDREKQFQARVMATYAAMIDSQDRHIARLLDYLRETGQLENTLIIYLTDNGPEGTDLRGKLSNPLLKKWVDANYSAELEDVGSGRANWQIGTSWANTATGALQWWKGFVSEGGIRVPMIISPPEQAVVRGHLGREEAAEDVEDGGESHGAVRVHAALGLRGGPPKIHLRLVAADPDDRPDRERPAAEAVVVHPVLGAVVAVRDLEEHGAKHPLRVSGELRGGPGEEILSVLRREVEHPALPRDERGALRGEVALALARRPDVREEQPQEVAIGLSTPHELHRGDSKPLLVDRAGGRHRARARAAHVRVVRAVREVEERPPAGPDRGDHRDVRQVRPAAERIVQQRHVAGSEVEILERGAHRERHRAQVDRYVGRLGGQPPLPVEDPAREIAALLDVRRKGGPAEHDPHLLGHRGEQMLENGEPDGVETGRSSLPRLHGESIIVCDRRTVRLAAGRRGDRIRNPSGESEFPGG